MEIATIPPIIKRQPIILKPSPSSFRPIISAIQIHIPPNTMIIIPAVKNGLKTVLLFFLSFNDIAVPTCHIVNYPTLKYWGL